MAKSYEADSIEVLEGLEPVKKRPGMYTDTSRPNHLAQEVIDNSVDVASVIIRNSGTEDKLVLYIKGIEILTGKLDELAAKVYLFLLISFKNKKNILAQAEQFVLQNLKNGPKRTSDLSNKKFERISLERLLHEMSSRQKLIRREGENWFINKLGRDFALYSERSE